MITAFEIVAAQFVVMSLASAFSHHIYDEDGREIIGEAFHVYVTAPNGRRWVHEQGFLTVLRSNEEGIRYAVGYEEAKAQSEALATKVAMALNSGQRLNSERWTEIDPAYGSEAYAKGGFEDERRLAEREAA